MNRSEEITTFLAGVRPGRFQKRKRFDPAALSDLAQSIAAQGLINPPLVFQVEDGYELLAGERRWRALCILAIAAHFPDPDAAIPVVAHHLQDHLTGGQWTEVLAASPLQVRVTRSRDPKTWRALAAIENIQREDLDPIEQAEEYQALLDDLGSVKAVARQIGKSTTHIKGVLRRLDLEAEIQALVAAGKLPKSRPAIEALLSIPLTAARLKAASAFAQRGSTIAQIEAGCQRVVLHLAREAEPPAGQNGRLASQNGQPAASRTVPVAEMVRVKKLKKPQRLPPRESPYEMCAGCASQILEAAEELCGPCTIDALSDRCRHCDGFLEFIRLLLEAAHRSEEGEAGREELEIMEAQAA